MLTELLQLAIGNLFRARGRLIMTASGVLVGTMAIVLLLAFTEGLQRAAESGIGSDASLTEVRVYPGFSRQQDDNDLSLTPATVATLRQIPGVAGIAPLLSLQARASLVADDYRYYGQMIGIAPEDFPYLGVQSAQGIPSLEPGEIVIGSTVAEYFVDPDSENWEPVAIDLATQQIELLIFSTADSREETYEVTVSAELNGTSSSLDGAVFLPLTDLFKYSEAAAGYATDPEDLRYDYLIVRATSREVTNNVSAAIRDLGYGTGGVGEFLDQLNNFFLTMRLVLGGIGGIALLVAAFGVANTMTMAILERTREIGLMKALGARDRDVLFVFLIESTLVGLVGGLAGVAAAYGLQDTVNNAIQNAPQEGGPRFLPFDFSQIGEQLLVIPPELALFAIGLAMLVGLGAGVLPAIRAARMPPVIALQTE